MVIDHPAEFGGHWHCDSEDITVLAIMVLVLVISKDQVTQEPCNSLGQSASKQVNTLPRLMTIGNVVAEI